MSTDQNTVSAPSDEAMKAATLIQRINANGEWSRTEGPTMHMARAIDLYFEPLRKALIETENDLRTLASGRARDPEKEAKDIAALLTVDGVGKHEKGQALNRLFVLWTKRASARKAEGSPSLSDGVTKTS